MPTLDEGSLAVRQLGGDPNHGIHIPGFSGPPVARQPSSRGAKSWRSGPRRERKREGAGDGAPSQRTMRVLPQTERTTRRRGQHPRGAAKRRGPSPGGSSAATAPWWGSRPPSTRGRRRWRGRRSLTTFAAAPAAGEKIGGSAAALSGAADSSAATDDTAPCDATTTDRAKTTNPAATARSASGRGPLLEVRGVLGRKEGPPSRPGQMGVV
jgi:hypothetical protein